MKQAPVVDPEKFKEVLKKRGFKSISHLAKASGVHRNTIAEYLSTRTSPFQTTFLKISSVLKTNAFELLSDSALHTDKKILSLLSPHIQEYTSQNPALCVVLLASEEDEDGVMNIKLGFTSGKAQLGNPEFTITKIKLTEATKRRKVLVECFNLDTSSAEFLTSISDGYRHLAGNDESFVYLTGFIRGVKNSQRSHRKTSFFHN